MMDKEAQEQIEAEYKFWTGNCPHPDFYLNIIGIMEELGYRKLPKDKSPIHDDDLYDSDFGRTTGTQRPKGSRY